MLAGRSARSLSHLEWRIRLFGAGAILAMVGIFADQRWLVTVALAVLALGFALRFLGRRHPEADEDEGEGSAQD